MSITDNDRMTIKVCELYYKDNLSQKEISYQLGISRPQISRILSSARAKNIVTIRIDNPYKDESNLEKALVKRYGLSDALVINTEGLSAAQALTEFGRQVSDQMDAYIPNDSMIGVMSGRTIAQTAKALTKMDKKGLEFVPLIGGMGSSGFDWHANIIVKMFADKTNGKYNYLNAPVVVKNVESKVVLMKEPEIQNVLMKGTQCDVVILGIGQVGEKSASVVAGSLGIKEVNYLKKKGATASVCATYLNERGEIIENDITNRSIGQTLEQITKAKKIALAMGRSKTEAIRAVLEGRHLNVLITNVETAKGILGNYEY